MLSKPKTTKIDIKDIPKAAVLAALYNGAKGIGVEALFSNMNAPHGTMTIEQAENVLQSVAPRHYVDYCSGQIIKVDLRNDDYFDSYLYDREYGEGYAEMVISELRERYRKGEEPGKIETEGFELPNISPKEFDQMEDVDSDAD